MLFLLVALAQVLLTHCLREKYLELLRVRSEKGMIADRKRGIWSRRDFFTRLGWAGFGFFSFATLLGFIRAAFPRVLFLPPSTFKAGFPSDYAMGEVNEKYKQDYRVWIVREDEGIYAIFAKCTHLGCTPRWLATEDKFKCPCHGSGFYKSGMNFEGPAPRTLDRFRIYRGEDGQLVVDKSKVFKMEPGAEPDEQYPESVLAA
jgi:cytochrome b6-f complex iron-sulfur subunit